MQAVGTLVGGKPNLISKSSSVCVPEPPGSGDLSWVYSKLICQRDELASLRNQADAFISRAKGSNLPITVDLDGPMPAVEGGLFGSIEREIALIEGLTADLRDRMTFIGGLA